MKNYMCVCVCVYVDIKLNHYAVHMKLTHQCNYTLIQKIKKRKKKGARGKKDAKILTVVGLSIFFSVFYFLKMFYYSWFTMFCQK